MNRANRLIKRLLLTSVLLLLASNSHSENELINVTLDVFPPFSHQDGTGLSMQLFREIENRSNFKFVITTEHLDSAKLSLRRGKTDIIGHLAVEKETEAMMKFSQLLDIRVPFVADLYLTDPSKFDDMKRLTVGTLRGSRQVAANTSGIPIQQFIGFSDTENMLNNLIKGTIDAIYFERAVIMMSSKKMGIKGLYYFHHPKQTFHFSYATAKDSHGDALKDELDRILKTIDIQQLFSEYESYLKMPSQGLVEEHYKH